MHKRVSVNALCFGQASLPEQAQMWRELAPRRISFLSHQLDAEGEVLAREIVAEGNYRVATLSHAFHMGVLPDDEAGWQAPRESLSEAIRIAASLGAESIYMVTGGRGRRSWEQAAELFSAAIAPCLPAAREAGVPILIETAPFFYGKVHIAHTLRDTIALAEMAGIGVCIDLFSSWSEAGLKQLIERALPIAHLVQVGDYVCGENSFPARAVPGDGDIPLVQLIEWIVRGGYSGSFDLELIGPRIAQEGYVQAAGRSAGFVGEVLDRLGA
jgi:sugar phosphate isomerase/epimerase